MEYRTKQQFEEIINTNHNGNLTKSYELAEEYGFHASDLIEFYTEDYYWFNVMKLISIAEGAERVRAEIELKQANDLHEWTTDDELNAQICEATDGMCSLSHTGGN